MARGFFTARKIVPYQNLQQEVKYLIAGFNKEHLRLLQSSSPQTNLVLQALKVLNNLASHS